MATPAIPYQVSPPLFSGASSVRSRARRCDRLACPRYFDRLRQALVGLPAIASEGMEGFISTARPSARARESFEAALVWSGSPKVKRCARRAGGSELRDVDCVDRGFRQTNVFTCPRSNVRARDNRDTPPDSRSSRRWIHSAENVIGRVGMVFFSRDAGGDGTPMSFVTGGSARWCIA